MNLYLLCKKVNNTAQLILRYRFKIIRKLKNLTFLILLTLFTQSARLLECKSKQINGMLPFNIKKNDINIIACCILNDL